MKFLKLGLKTIMIPTASTSELGPTTSGGLMVICRGDLNMEIPICRKIDNFSHAVYLRLQRQSICLVNIYAVSDIEQQALATLLVNMAGSG